MIIKTLADVIKFVNEYWVCVWFSKLSKEDKKEFLYPREDFPWMYDFDDSFTSSGDYE